MTARLWTATELPILASQSTARQALLRNAGFDFDAIPADVDERTMQRESGLADAGAIAALLAREKALAVAAQHSGRIVIGADQTLALGDRLFSKPASRAQATEQLQALAGRTHHLHSAVAVARDRKMLFATVSVAAMTMRPLDDAAIESYLAAAGRAVSTSVGAYQLEGLGTSRFSACRCCRCWIFSGVRVC